MKILILGSAHSPIIKRLRLNLENSGHKVLLASHNSENLDGIIDLGKLNGFCSYLNFWKVRNLIKKYQPDLVHAHVLNHYGLMSALQSKPLIIALWGSDVMLAPNQGNYFKKLIYKAINFFVLSQATILHTSGTHVAEEAIKQCKASKNKINVFYWGFPLVKSDQYSLEVTRNKLTDEFDLKGSGFIVFPRGVGPVYNPIQTAEIINYLLSKDTDDKIIVLKGFANVQDVQKFKTLVDFSKIIFVDRLLNQDELYYLYDNANIHFSIPISDSLGGGVVEPALLGSFPILSNLPSYSNYLMENKGYILKDYSESSLAALALKIKSGQLSKSEENKPNLDYSLVSIMDKFTLIYEKALLKTKNNES